MYNCVPRPITAERRYNPVSGDVQRDICRDLGMNFIEANECVPGGADVRLKPPTSIRSIGGDGNCLFRALSYAVTGSESQHHVVRRQHLTTDRCWRLLENYLSTDNTIEEYVQRTHMARNGVWGTNIAFCNLAGVNIASYNNEDGTYHYYGPAVIDPEVFDHDDSRPTIHLAYTGGDHFNVIISQD